MSKELVLWDLVLIKERVIPKKKLRGWIEGLPERVYGVASFIDDAVPELITYSGKLANRCQIICTKSQIALVRADALTKLGCTQVISFPRIKGIEITREEAERYDLPETFVEPEYVKKARTWKATADSKGAEVFIISSGGQFSLQERYYCAVEVEWTTRMILTEGQANYIKELGIARSWGEVLSGS